MVDVLYECGTEHAPGQMTCGKCQQTYVFDEKKKHEEESCPKREV